jgi:leader peptidase (prepilin peptidase) / N-methyltransferase
LPAEAAALWPLLAALFGLLIGSFLNVCIYRIPRDLSVVRPRSFCPECGARIAWFDNIPVISFALLGGRCRHCAKSIGWRYPAVEAATAILFAGIAGLFGLTLLSAKWLLFEAILFVLFVSVLEERILPDELTIGGSVAGLVFAIFIAVPGCAADVLVRGWGIAATSLVNAAAGACLLSVPIAAIGFLYAKLRHRRGLGLGDLKLLALVGIFLGVEKGVLALLVAAVGGSILGLIYILLKREHAGTYELPFGSFVCFAAGLIPLSGRV